MLLDTFGEEYRAYMQRTGGVIPKIYSLGWQEFILD